MNKGTRNCPKTKTERLGNFPRDKAISAAAVPHARPCQVDNGDRSHDEISKL